MSEQPKLSETVRDLLVRAHSGNSLQSCEQGWLKKSEVQFLLAQAIALLPDPTTQPPPQPAAEKRATHTPEPWMVAGDSIISVGSSQDTCIANIETDGGYEAIPEWQESNAARIVACVNACAGMTDAELATLRPSPVDAGELTDDQLDKLGRLFRYDWDYAFDPRLKVILKANANKIIFAAKPPATDGVSDGVKVERLTEALEAVNSRHMSTHGFAIIANAILLPARLDESDLEWATRRIAEYAAMTANQPGNQTEG